MIRLRTPRTFGNRQNKEGVREPASLIVVACEGQTEEEYFRLFSRGNTGVIVKVTCVVLEKKDPVDHKSAPIHVLSLLQEYKEYYQIDSETGSDELWMVVDRDEHSNPKKNLEDIVSQCEQEEFNIAISNPAFELWLLLHVKDISEYDEGTLMKIKENKRISKSKKSKRFLSKELSNILGGYKKGAVKPEVFLPKVKIAIERAKAIDRNNQPRKIDNLGTTVFLLVERIIEK